LTNIHIPSWEEMLIEFAADQDFYNSIWFGVHNHDEGDNNRRHSSRDYST
jgi:hypothetical protein